MQLRMLKGKIHRARVTEARLDYVGSITIDEELMKAAGILEYEQVQVVDVNNGNRLITYTIVGEAGSGIICLNGAAAKLINPDDLVIIMAYCDMNIEDAKNYRPKVVFVDENNRVSKVISYEKHGRVENLK